MRSAKECAEAARRLIRPAGKERDPKIKSALSRASANQAQARFVDRLARGEDLLRQRVISPSCLGGPISSSLTSKKNSMCFTSNASSAPAKAATASQ